MSNIPELKNTPWYSGDRILEIKKNKGNAEFGLFCWNMTTLDDVKTLLDIIGVKSKQEPIKGLQEVQDTVDFIQEQLYKIPSELGQIGITVIYESEYKAFVYNQVAFMQYDLGKYPRKLFLINLSTYSNVNRFYPASEGMRSGDVVKVFGSKAYFAFEKAVMRKINKFKVGIDKRYAPNWVELAIIIMSEMNRLMGLKGLVRD